MSTFSEVSAKHVPTLDVYVPVVARVHGGTHPEFHEVKAVYDRMAGKLAESGDADLSEDFTELRRITNDYAVPGDVCESYEAVYSMLSELDAASQA